MIEMRSYRNRKWLPAIYREDGLIDYAENVKSNTSSLGKKAQWITKYEEGAMHTKPRKVRWIILRQKELPTMNRPASATDRTQTGSCDGSYKDGSHD